MLTTHPTLTLWLDLADKAIKLIAVLLGGIWTYWNYHKSRTYRQKMELKIAATTFRRDGLFLEIAIGLKNLGAGQHVVEQDGTYCTVNRIHADQVQETLLFAPVFASEQFIEPGESISDLLLLDVRTTPPDVIWFRIDLRVVSNGIEWRHVDFVRAV